MSTALENDIDTSILDDLEFSHVDPTICEYTDCEAEATHMLLCPCNEGAENTCTPHAEEIREAVAIGRIGVIRFDHTCGHNVLLHQCTLIPL